MSFPRSRLAEHGEHPAHFTHLHFFSQIAGLFAHQGLHIFAAGELVVVVAAGELDVVVAAGELVVVVIVSVVVTMPAHEQQGSPVLSFVHLWHSKDPPCATQDLMFLSTSHVDSDDVDVASVVVVAGIVVVAGGTVDVLVLGHCFHWHLFSY